MVPLKTILFFAVTFEVASVTDGFAYSPALSSIKSGLLKLKLRTAAVKISSRHHNPRLRRSTIDSRQRRKDLLLDVAKSLNKLTGFIAREAEKGNDDLLLSLRIAQGQLTQLRAEAPGLRDESEASQLLESAVEDLAHADAVLLRNFRAKKSLSEEFSFMLERDVWDNLRQHDARSVFQNFERVWAEAYVRNRGADELKFSEEASDACLSQLRPRQNTREATEMTGRSSSCAVSDRCWRLMSKPFTQGYELTHQLLFLAIGWSTGCGPDLERLARRDFADKRARTAADVTPELMRHQCRRVLEEAKAISRAGYPDKDKDLFLEQGMLCGAAVRMPNFFKPTMIRSAISWQKRSGCFGFMDVDTYLNSLSPEEKAAYAMDLEDFPNDITKENRRDGMKSEDRKGGMYDHLEENPNAQVVRLFTGRDVRQSPTLKSRREKVMNRSCFSHNSAVAMGYLSVAMRYLASK